MTIDDYLRDRERALEESFFARRNSELLEQLKLEVQREKLAQASGIKDASVLDNLLAVHIGPETVMALSLAPLVAVAWADGKLEQKEREALLVAAGEEGIESGSVAYCLLEEWLHDPPGKELVQAWKDFMLAVTGSLSEPAVKTLREDVLGRANNVARAAGGILGVGSVSQSEQRVLDDLASAFPQ